MLPLPVTVHLPTAVAPFAHTSGRGEETSHSFPMEVSLDPGTGRKVKRIRGHRIVGVTQARSIFMLQASGLGFRSVPGKVRMGPGDPFAY